MIIRSRAISVFCVSILCASCTTVPPLTDVTSNAPFGSDIKVDDIVQRVKCELADTLDRKTVEQGMKWMQPWTVKADLTLQVNESGGITPNMLFVDPLKNAYNVASGPGSVSFPGRVPGTTVSATSQSFSFGVGGGYTGQVYRTETVSFALSLAELKNWRERGEGKKLACLPAGATDLEGNLDIGSWINTALDPVAEGHLAPGFHPDPGSGPAKGPTPAAAGAGGAVSEVDEKIAAQIAFYAQVAKDSATNATKSVEQLEQTLRAARISNFLSDAAKKNIEKLTDKSRSEAVSAMIAAQRINPPFNYPLPEPGSTSPPPPPPTHDDKSLSPTEYNLQWAKKNADWADTSAQAAALNLALATQLANPNPPIDSISHAVNFVVTTGISASPNWTLLTWKGPANAGNLLGYQGIRTHTLTIALGAPGQSVSPETNRVLDNAAFRQAIQSP